MSKDYTLLRLRAYMAKNFDNDMTKLAQRVIECDREGLLELILDLELSQKNHNEKVALLYAKVMNAYYHSELETLNLLAQKIDESKDLIISQIINFRIKLRKGNITEDIVHSLEKCKNESIWDGEIDFILGFYYSRQCDHESAKKSFLSAYSNYKEYSCLKKSMLSLQNYLTAECHLNPNKRMIPERKLLLKKSIEANALNTAGMASMDLSMEYEEIGALEMSLTCAKDALKYMSGHEETYQYGCVLVHYTRLCFKLNLLDEANHNLSILKSYSIDAISEKVRSLVEIQRGITPSEFGHNIMPWWQRHLKKNGQKVKLGKLGTRLMEILSEGPTSKEDLISKLYNAKIDYEALENRFNVLLSRVRKVVPDLIIFQDDGHYALKKDDVIERVINAS